MADVFDPYDEKDAFTAASLNDRMNALKDEINDIPMGSTARGGLGPSHIGSLLESATTQTKVLTPQEAIEATGTLNFFCDNIDSLYPGWLTTLFETGTVCWQRISDSTGGSGAGTQYLTLDLGTSFTLGSNKQNALLIMANIELCQLERIVGDGAARGAHNALATIIVTEDNSGAKTFHWRTLKVSTGYNTSAVRADSSDICHRAIIMDTSTIRYVYVLASTIEDTATWGRLPNSDNNPRARVRFCQLTAVALQAKVN